MYQLLVKAPPFAGVDLCDYLAIWASAFQYNMHYWWTGENIFTPGAKNQQPSRCQPESANLEFWEPGLGLVVTHQALVPSQALQRWACIACLYFVLISIHLQTNLSKEWGFGPKGVNELMSQESGCQLPYFSLATQNFRYFRNAFIPK